MSPLKLTCIDSKVYRVNANNGQRDGENAFLCDMLAEAEHHSPCAIQVLAP